MVDVSKLIEPKSCLVGMKTGSKKSVLQECAGFVAGAFDLDAALTFETLLQRERLGSTGVGDGIAIPHGRMKGLERLVGGFVRLEKPIDFEAMDGVPVDLIFVLLAPENAGADHLKALASMARLLRDTVVVERLRRASDATALYAILTQGASAKVA